MRRQQQMLGPTRCVRGRAFPRFIRPRRGGLVWNTCLPFLLRGDAPYVVGPPTQDGRGPGERKS